MDPLYWTIIAGAVLLALALGGATAWTISRRRRLETKRPIETEQHADENLSKRSNRSRRATQKEHGETLPTGTTKVMHNPNEETANSDARHRADAAYEDEFKQDDDRAVHLRTHLPETDEAGRPAMSRQAAPAREGRETTRRHGRASTRAGGVDEEVAVGARLFRTEDSDRLLAQWREIQAHFVDEPRQAVEQAAKLVSEVTDHITAAFTRNRNELERQWTAGDEVSTEDLRRTLRRYRSFFQRLLNV